MRVNHHIKAPQVRVIDMDGKMLGVLSREEALKLSAEKRLDLIEVAPQASPPTCRIMDYGKWKYENKKKKASSRKKQSVVVTKEIVLRPHIDKHDLDTKLRHARRFLEEGNKVKINVRFLGRERIYREKGLDLIRRILETLQDKAKPEMAPKSEGRFLFCILVPIKGGGVIKGGGLKEEAKGSGSSLSASAAPSVPASSSASSDSPSPSPSPQVAKIKIKSS